MNSVMTGARPVIARSLVSISAPMMMKKIAAVADTVDTAAWATRPSGLSLRVWRRVSSSAVRAAAAPASVGVKAPENMPPNSTSMMTGKPQTSPSDSMRCFQVTFGASSRVAPLPRPTSLGAKMPRQKMKRAKVRATPMPGTAPAMSCGPTGTEAMPA